MKKIVLTLLILTACLTLQLDARVVFDNNYIPNQIAIYNFNSEDYGHVVDQSLNGIDGILQGNAKLVKGKYNNSLLLEDVDSSFIALRTGTGLYYDLYTSHSICAWVKVAKQDTDFTISLQFIDPKNYPDVHMSELETVTGTQLAIKPDGNLGAVSHSIFFEEPYIDDPYYDDMPKPSVTDIESDVETDAKSDKSMDVEADDSFFSNGNYVQTKDQSVNDDSWHHISLVYMDGLLKLYVDGKPVCENDYYPGHLWNPSSYIALISVGGSATGYVDDLCLFHQGLDESYIQLLYELGIDKIMTVANVAPQDKIATTWGDIKSMHR